MTANILSSPRYWEKLANFSDEAPSPEQQELVLGEFISTMKTAGVNPLEIFGMLVGVAEVFAPSFINQKVADFNATAPIQPPVPAPVPDFASMSKADPPIAAGNIYPDGTARPAKPNASPVPGSVAGQQPTQAAAGGQANTGSAFTGKLDLGWNSGVMGALHRGAQHIRHFGDKIQGFVMGDQSHAVKYMNDEAQNQHPFIHNLVSGLISDPARRAEFYQNYQNGNWGKLLSQAGEVIGSNQMVKDWAPAVVPGLATLAASRLAGANWGTSALLGAGVGALSGEAGGVSKIPGLFRKTFLGTPNADGTSPDATEGRPTVNPATQSGGEARTSTEKIQDAGRDHAESILKRPQ